MKCKKGQVGQVVVFFVAIFVLSLSIVVGNFVYDSVTDNMRDNGVLTATAEETVTTMTNNFQMFDYAMAGLTLIFCAGMVITSFFIPSHPIFYAINIMGIFILVFVGMTMTNTYAEIVSGEGGDYFGDTADQYPTINFIIQYMPFLGVILLVLSTTVMFSRSL